MTYYFQAHHYNDIPKKKKQKEADTKRESNKATNSMNLQYEGTEIYWRLPTWLIRVHQKKVSKSSSLTFTQNRFQSQMLYLLKKMISELKLNYQETGVEHDGELNQVTSARAKDLVKWNPFVTGLKIEFAGKILWYENSSTSILGSIKLQ